MNFGNQTYYILVGRFSYSSENSKEEKQSPERRSEKRKSHAKESKKKKDKRARKGAKVLKHSVFQCVVPPEGRKKGSLKRRVRSHLLRSKTKKGPPLWHKAHVEVRTLKAPRYQSTWEVERFLKTY